MSQEIKKENHEDKRCDVAENVMAAANLSKDIPKNAHVWVVTHVVQPGDCITLLMVLPS